MSNKRSVKSILTSLANKIKGELTIPAIYQSQGMYKYLNAIATTVCGGECIRPDIHVIAQGADGLTACTNGAEMYINCETEAVRRFSAEESCFTAFIGLLYHELAHVRYNDFDATKVAMRTIGRGMMYAEEPATTSDEEMENLHDLQTAMSDPQYAPLFSMIYSNLDNIVIDPHDEDKLIEEFGGMAERSIMKLRESLLATPLSLEKAEEKVANGEIDKLSAMFALTLNFARFGEILCFDESLINTSEYGRTMYRMTPHVERARWTDDPRVRFSELNAIVLQLWPFIRDEIEDMKKQQASQNGQSGQQSSQNSNGQSSQNGGSQGQSGQSNGQGQQSSNGQGQSGSGQNSSQQQPTPEQMQQIIQKVIEQLNQAAQNAPQTAAPTGKSSQAAKKNTQSARQSNGQPQSGNGQTGGSPFPGGSANGSMNGQTGAEVPNGDPAQAAINSALEQIMSQTATEEAAEELEKEQGTAISRGVTGILSQTSSHQNIPVNVNRIIGVSDTDIQRYNEEMKDISLYSKRLQKLMEEIMRDMRMGGLNRHKAYGKIICVDDAYRLDGLMFANKKAPVDLPDMAISVLVDHSGSMRGERIYASMKAAMLLHDFATGIGIPVSVAGHRCPSGRHVEYIVYTDFDQFSDNDRYRLAKMRAGGCNRDGAAIEISAKRLEERPEKLKLLIVISDGQPNDDGYGGEAAVEDIKSIISKYRRKGVEIIGAAIGDDKEEISAIYGDGFLDIDDLSAFPKIMTKLVQKRLLSQIM